MVVDINIAQLGNLVSEVNGLISDYEDVQLNIFNQLKDSCVNWQDGNSLEFESKIQNEKQTSKSFLNALKNDQKMFQFVYDEYKSIGNKLHFNLDKKAAIITAIDDCIAKANLALKEFETVNRSFYYGELGMIDAQRNKIASCKNNLQKLKNKINDLYKTVTNIESKVSSKIAKLEEIKVGSFSYNFK